MGSNPSVGPNCWWWEENAAVNMLVNRTGRERGRQVYLARHSLSKPSPIRNPGISLGLDGGGVQVWDVMVGFSLLQS